MKLKKFFDGELTVSLSVDDCKNLAKFLSTSTSVIVDYRDGFYEYDNDKFIACLDDLIALSKCSFNMRRFFNDLANAL